MLQGRLKTLPVALFMLFALAVVALAQSSFPTLTGRVVDEAGLMDAATRHDLTAKLAALEAKTTDQFVVVTVKSLGGRSIEDYGVNLGRTWKIGQKDKNNGVLLIVAPNVRKVRIEVGYGLEGTLTDAISKYIIENSILPRFKAGDFVGGIRRGAEDIIQVLSGDAAAFKQRAAQRRSNEFSPMVNNAIVLVLALIFASVIGIVVFAVMIGLLSTVHGILAGLGFVKKKPKEGFWHWVNERAPSGGSSSSSGSSSGGFSGGGGSFGGGGSSGSW